MDGFAEPVYSRVTTDGLVLWIDENYFVEFVYRVLANPVGVEYSQATTVTTRSLLEGGRVCVCVALIVNAGTGFNEYRHYA